MRRWQSFAGVFLVLALLVSYGVWRSSIRFPDFWHAFEPNLWSNIIGVSVAAIIGIPMGYAINHYFFKLSEQQHSRHQINKVRDLLQLVAQEVNLHSGSFQALGQLFPPEGTQSSTQLQPINPATIAGYLLKDMFGRQFLKDQSAFDIGESLICFEVGNYYTRVGELNHLLELRIKDTQQPEVWDRSIRNVVQSVWIAQQQVGFEITQAIDRLSATATH